MKPQHTSNRRNLMARAAQFSLLALLTGGWTNQLQPPTASKDVTTLAEDSRYMGRMLAQRRLAGQDTLQVDLADPQQHRFVMNRLRAAGKTSENSPYLYERINEMRSRAQARQAAAAQGRPFQEMTTTSTEPWVCEHFLRLENKDDTGSQRTYNTGPVGSCEGGANYVFADIIAYDSDASGENRTELASNSGEQFSGGTNFDDVTVDAAMSTESGRMILSDSMMIAMDDTGEEAITFTEISSVATPVAPSIGLQHPRLPGTLKTELLSCQLRGGTDCDYAVVGKNSQGEYIAYHQPLLGVAMRKTATTTTWTGDPSAFFPFAAGTAFDSNRVYVPLRSTYSAGSGLTDICRITSVQPASKLRIVKTVAGGVCSSSADLQGDLNAFVGSSTATLNRLFDVSRETITGGPQCSMARVTNDVVDLVLTVSVKVDCGNGEESQAVTLRPSALPLNAWKLKVLNSCMAEGTHIARPDGTTTPIQQLKEGDKVVSNTNGRVLTVTDVLHGNEFKPLVHLRDSLGHAVRLTEQHPVVLSSGKVVTAAQVKVRDQVRTDRGLASITSVKRMPYSGKVYNLALGTAEELAGLGKMDSTLFAGGLLVGDNAMQVELGTPRRTHSDALASLPNAWHEDYRYASARHQR